VLGHLIGGLAHDEIPVLDGLSVAPTEDDLKALGAAMASSGAVALFHWVGVTPEAPTLEEAFQGNAPNRTVEIGFDDLRRARDDLHSATGDALDLVVLGSPHFSLEEFRRLAPMLERKHRHPAVRFLVTSGRGVRAIAERAGLLAPIEEFGGTVTVDTCIITTPMLGDDVRVLMTNSAKYAYYGPGLLGKTVAFGSMEDCVRSAVDGRIVRDDSAWSGP
jgi:hypothetical protein